MFETLLVKAFQGELSYFSNLVNEFPLTYRCKLIDEKSVSGLGAKRSLSEFRTKHKPSITLPSA
jgi:hypothetical protein